MALPAPVNGTFTTSLGFAGKHTTGEAGPWFYNGWVFGLFYDTTNDTIEVWNSTNTTSGTSSFVRGELWEEADSANHIVGDTTTANGADEKLPSGLRVNNLVWTCHINSSQVLELNRFDLVTRSWGVGSTSTLSAVAAGAFAHEFQGGNSIGLAPIDGDNIRIVYSTFTGTLLNSYYTEYNISAGTFGTQSGPINGTGSSYEYYNACVLPGKDGRTHVFYEAVQRPADGSNDGTNLHRSISSDGTLGTQQTIRDLGYNGANFGYDLGLSVYDATSGEYRIIVPTGHDQEFNMSFTWHPPILLYGTSAADPTWAETTLTTDTTYPNADNENHFSVAFPCPDPNKIWYVYPGVPTGSFTSGTGVNNGDFDLYLAKSNYGTDSWTNTKIIDFADVVGTGSPNFGETYNIRNPRIGSDGGTVVGVFFGIGNTLVTCPTWYTELSRAFSSECCPSGTSSGGNFAYLT